MRAYVTIRFDRKLSPNGPFPSLGGFHVQVKSKTYGFDFNNSEISVNTEDPSYVHWELWDEDYDSFPETKNLIKQVEMISEIEEIYIDLEAWDVAEERPVPIKCTEFCLKIESENQIPKSTKYVNVHLLKKPQLLKKSRIFLYEFTSELLEPLTTKNFVG